MTGEYRTFKDIKRDIYKGFKKEKVEAIVEEMVNMCCDQLNIEEDVDLLPDYCLNSTFSTLINLAIRGKELFRKSKKEFDINDFIV